MGTAARTLAWIGAAQGAIAPADWVVVWLEPQDVFRESLAGRSLVLLGARALAALDAPVTRRVLGGSVKNTWIITDHVPADVLVRWVSSGFTQCCSADRIGELSASHAPKWADALPADEIWVPAARSGDRALASRLIAALRRTPRPRVLNWRREAGLSERTLAQTCRHLWSESPRSIVARATVAAFDRWRDRGRSLRECARLVGYADASTLRRGIRLARKHVKPR